MEQIAIVTYGDGGELGSFKIFADTLHKELIQKYKKVIIQHVTRDADFLSLIKSVDNDEEINELHIFSHSIGAGLFLGYRDVHIAVNRETTWRVADNAKRKVTYHEAVNIETGAIQTDDFKTKLFEDQKNALRKKFSKDAFIKIWGCSSGVRAWVYSDNGVVDPNDTSEKYYWRAFNEFNIPKPSIAKAFSEYFNRKVYGALSEIGRASCRERV